MLPRLVYNFRVILQKRIRFVCAPYLLFWKGLIPWLVPIE